MVTPHHSPAGRHAPHAQHACLCARRLRACVQARTAHRSCAPPQRPPPPLPPPCAPQSPCSPPRPWSACMHACVRAGVHSTTGMHCCICHMCMHGATLQYRDPAPAPPPMRYGLPAAADAQLLRHAACWRAHARPFMRARSCADGLPAQLTSQPASPCASPSPAASAQARSAASTQA